MSKLYSDALDAQCSELLGLARERRELGALKYGEGTWEAKSMAQEAEFELLDLINYSLFALIKLRKIRNRFPTL